MKDILKVLTFRSLFLKDELKNCLLQAANADEFWHSLIIECHIWIIRRLGIQIQFNGQHDFLIFRALINIFSDLAYDFKLRNAMILIDSYFSNEPHCNEP